MNQNLQPTKLKAFKIFLLQLTGIYGLHPDAYHDDAVNFKIITDEHNTSLKTIIINRSAHFRQIIVQIDLNLKTIKNELIVAKDGVPGATLQCLASQIDYAVEAGFEYIKLLAWRDDNNPYKYKNESIPWTGYYVWGKYGYTMNPTSRHDFSILISKCGHTFDYIHELYTGTANANIGKSYWKENGNYWNGKFDLEHASLSQIVLDKLKAKWNLGNKFVSHVFQV